MKNAGITLLLWGLFFGTMQAQLNDYKYIIIPKHLQPFSSANQHKSSTLLKHLFVNNGFTAVYDDALPDDLNTNRCLGLIADLEEDSSMLVTRISIVLKDCKNAEVISTVQGTSKLKDFEKAYHQAIREAFQFFEDLGYEYKPKVKPQPEVKETVVVSFKDDVKQIEPPKKEETSENQTKSEAVVIVQATPAVQSYENKSPVSSTTMVKAEEAKDTEVTPKETMDTGILYAQQTENGYQLVDSTPAVRYRLFASSVPNVYLAETDNTKGVVYQKDSKWYFEYYQGSEVILEELKIKF